jgi:hypothetical protein
MRKIHLAIFALLLPVSLAAQCANTTYQDPGATYYISVPQAPCFNGDVILFAHGYVPVGSPAGTWLSQLALPDGTSLPALVNSYGFGFAASGFSKDGLAILQGITDTKALTAVISGLGVPVNKYFIAGASEGGLIAAKSVESDPTYSGGVAVCGPVGSFQKQIDYVGDVRVLFDYFFPGVLTSAGGDATHIPPALILHWYDTYEQAVRNAVNSNFFATFQLINTAKIPIGLSYANAADAITGVLWYNVFATNDANATLGGNPYGNIGRIYHGSFNDFRLNTHVARFSEDAGPLMSLPAYETTGLLGNPLVTLHTLADPTIPFWQETLYGAKVQATGSSSELTQIPVLRYGHCNVTGTQAAFALQVLLLKAGL